MPLNHTTVDGQFVPLRAFQTPTEEGRIVIHGNMDERACEEGAGRERGGEEGTYEENELGFEGCREKSDTVVQREQGR